MKWIAVLGGVLVAVASVVVAILGTVSADDAISYLRKTAERDFHGGLVISGAHPGTMYRVANQKINKVPVCNVEQFSVSITDGGDRIYVFENFIGQAVNFVVNLIKGQDAHAGEVPVVQRSTPSFSQLVWEVKEVFIDDFSQTELSEACQKKVSSYLNSGDNICIVQYVLVSRENQNVSYAIEFKKQCVTFCVDRENEISPNSLTSWEMKKKCGDNDAIYPPRPPTESTLVYLKRTLGLIDMRIVHSEGRG